MDAETTTQSPAAPAKYWAMEQTENFGSRLQGQLDTFHAQLQASRHISYVATAYVHFFGKDAEGVGADAATITRSGEQGEIVEIRVPNSRALANGVLNIVTGPKLAWQPVATTNDFESKAQAITAANACEYYWKDCGVEAIAVAAALEEITFGEGFVFTPWDPEAGGDAAGIDGRMVKEGDIAFRQVHTWDVIRDPAYTSWDDLPWIAFRGHENKHDVVARYVTPEHPELEAAILSQAQDYQHWSPYRTPTISTDVIPVIYFFHKRTPACPAGRETIMLMGGRILSDAPLHQAYHKHLPLHRFSSEPYAGTPYPYASYWAGLGTQQMSDGIHVSLATNITNTSGGLVSAETGSDLPVEQLGATGPRVIYRKPGSQAPTVISLQQSSSDSFKYLQELRTEAQQNMGLNSTTMGQPEGANLSGAALALLSSMSIQAISRRQATWVAFVAELGTAVLHQIQCRMSVPRKIALSGKGRSSLVKALELCGPMVAGIERTQVDIGNPLQQTAAGRYELAQLLLQAAQQGGGTLTPEQLQSCMDSGRVDPMTQALSNELLLIAEENEALSDGKQVPVTLYDDHKLHLKEHRSVGACLDARENPATVGALQAHMAQHIEILRTTDPVILTILGQQALPPPPPPAGPPLPGAQPPPGAMQQLTKMPTGSRGPDMPSQPANPLTKEKFAPAGGVNPTPIQ